MAHTQEAGNGPGGNGLGSVVAGGGGAFRARGAAAHRQLLEGRGARRGFCPGHSSCGGTG